MTWTNHYAATGALALALTGRVDVAAAAVATAALPDQLEAFLPLGKHRGATHWLVLWLALLVAVPLYFPHDCARLMLSPGWHPLGITPLLTHWRLGTAVFGLALGPFLHVLLDGCSKEGVPVVPFSRAKLQLCLYRTRNRRWPWDVTEWAFVAFLLAACAWSAGLWHADRHWVAWLHGWRGWIT